MNLKKCHCGGDSLVFKEKKPSRKNLCDIFLKYGQEAAERAKYRGRPFWAECLSCWAKSEEGSDFSQSLLEMVNEARMQCGEKPVRNNDFIDRIKDELEGEFYKSFVKPSSANLRAKRIGTET